MTGHRTHSAAVYASNNARRNTSWAMPRLLILPVDGGRFLRLPDEVPGQIVRCLAGAREGEWVAELVPGIRPDTPVTLAQVVHVPGDEALARPAARSEVLAAAADRLTRAGGDLADNASSG